MAGGTTTIILKNFTNEDFIWLDNYIRERSVVNAFFDNKWDIHAYLVNNKGHKRSKKAIANQDLRPFVVACSDKKDIFDGELENQTLLKTLGYSSTCAIDIAAMCSDPLDEYLQAAFSIAVAVHFDGLISLNGLLTPCNADKCSLDDAKTFARSIAGKVYFAEYDLEYGGKWANQLVDATYLSNWMLHQDFRMIK